MIDRIMKKTNLKDENGNPAGGECSGNGVNIRWQNGPLGRDENRKDPNGAFVETIILCAIDRLKFYQNSKFECFENDEAIKCLESAVGFLKIRTKRRVNLNVEGTHKVG